jgi:hypothetical protein
MAEATLSGVVVAQQPGDEIGIAPSPNDGLYLLTDDGQLIALVRDAMYVQMSWEHIWRRSRPVFEPLLGQHATIQGYLSRRTLYGAAVVTPAAHDSTVDPLSH